MYWHVWDFGPQLHLDKYARWLGWQLARSIMLIFQSIANRTPSIPNIACTVFLVYICSYFAFTQAPPPSTRGTWAHLSMCMSSPTATDTAPCSASSHWEWIQMNGPWDVHKGRVYVATRTHQAAQYTPCMAILGSRNARISETPCTLLP